MTPRVLYIEPSGEIKTVITTQTPTLQEMQEFVKGSIEVVNTLFHNAPTQMIVNEEGLIHKMPLNWKATSVYHCNWITREGKIPDAPICGPAILLQGINLD